MMLPYTASQLLFDTDEKSLFETDEIARDAVWVSARVYRSVREKTSHYEVWLFEWAPSSNEEKYKYMQSFTELDDAKNFALEICKSHFAK